MSDQLASPFQVSGNSGLSGAIWEQFIFDDRLTRLDLKVLGIIANDPYLDQRDIADSLEVTPRAVKFSISRMKNAGIIKVEVSSWYDHDKSVPQCKNSYRILAQPSVAKNKEASLDSPLLLKKQPTKPYDKEVNLDSPLLLAPEEVNLDSPLLPKKQPTKPYDKEVNLDSPLYHDHEMINDSSNEHDTVIRILSVRFGGIFDHHVALKFSERTYVTPIYAQRARNWVQLGYWQFTAQRQGRIIADPVGYIYRIVANNHPIPDVPIQETLPADRFDPADLPHEPLPSQQLSLFDDSIEPDPTTKILEKLSIELNLQVSQRVFDHLFSGMQLSIDKNQYTIITLTVSAAEWIEHQHMSRIQQVLKGITGQDVNVKVVCMQDAQVDFR